MALSASATAANATTMYRTIMAWAPRDDARRRPWPAPSRPRRARRKAPGWILPFPATRSASLEAPGRRYAGASRGAASRPRRERDPPRNTRRRGRCGTRPAARGLRARVSHARRRERRPPGRRTQRPAEIFPCPGHLFHQDVVAAKLLHLDATKPGTIDQVQVIGHRVSKGSEAVLDSILLEVRLDTGRRHLGMEHREDEPPSSHEA